LLYRNIEDYCTLSILEICSIRSWKTLQAYGRYVAQANNYGVYLAHSSDPCYPFHTTSFLLKQHRKRMTEASEILRLPRMAVPWCFTSYGSDDHCMLECTDKSCSKLHEFLGCSDAVIYQSQLNQNSDNLWQPYLFKSRPGSIERTSNSAWHSCSPSYVSLYPATQYAPPCCKSLS
jgi:hypothetical protein